MSTRGGVVAAVGLCYAMVLSGCTDSAGSVGSDARVWANAAVGEFPASELAEYTCQPLSDKFRAALDQSTWASGMSGTTKVEIGADADGVVWWIIALWGSGGMPITPAHPDEAGMWLFVADHETIVWSVGDHRALPIGPNPGWSAHVRALYWQYVPWAVAGDPFFLRTQRAAAKAMSCLS